MTENASNAGGGILQRRATPQRVRALFARDVLPIDAWDDAHTVAGITPTRIDWLGYLDRLALVAGTVFVLAGIVFFFAFNWADLPQLARFGIVQGAMVITLIASLLFGMDTWPGRMLLLASAVMIGVTLAVVGQAYQTGADSYRLFMLWTLLISGLVIVSRWNVMWLMWAVLFNLTLMLYMSQLFNDIHLFILGIGILVTFGVALGWDVLARTVPWDFLRARWHLYLMIAWAVGLSVFVYIFDIFMLDTNDVYAGRGLGLLLYPALVIVGAGFYYGYLRDLGVLALLGLSLIVVVDATLLRLFIGIGDPIALFCVMSILTIGMTIGLTVLLRNLQKQEANA